MTRWLRMAPLLVAVAVVAAVLVRERHRRAEEVTAKSTPHALPPEPRTSAQPARPRVSSLPQSVELGVSEGAGDAPPPVDFKDAASIRAYREYFANKARQYGEYIAPIVFEDAGRDMDLDPARHQALISLYIEFNARSNAASHAPDTDQAAKIEELENIRGDRERALQELLGPAGMKALVRYRRTLDARMQVQELVRELEPSQFRMSDAQRRRLLDALLKPGGYSPDREYSVTESPEAVRQEVLARFDQNQGRLRDAARRILTPEQFGICVLYLEDTRRSAIVEATPYFARDLRAR